MAAKTNYLQAAIINAVVSASAFSSPATVWVALFTTAPTDAYTSGSPTGVEVAGNAYARQVIAFGAPAGSPETALNSGVITFPAASPGAWGTVVAFGIFDALTLGNLLLWDTLTAPVVVNATDTFQFPISSISYAEN